MNNGTVYLPSTSFNNDFLDAVASEKAYLRPGQWVNVSGQNVRYVTKDDKGSLFFSYPNKKDSMLEWNSRFTDSYYSLVHPQKRSFMSNLWNNLKKGKVSWR